MTNELEVKIREPKELGAELCRIRSASENLDSLALLGR